MGGGWWWWWRQGEPWRAGAGRNFFQQQRRALPGMTKKKRVGGDHPRRHRRQQTPAGPPPTSPAPRPDRETGKRPRSEDGPRPSANGGASGPAAAAASIAPHAIQWLERRKKKVPDALRGAVAGASLLDVDGLLGHVAGLRERERRSLVRYVEKCVRDRAGDGAAGGGGSARVELEGSDGEYDADDADGGARRGVGDDWPADVEFSNDYRWDPAVPDDVKREYVPPPGPGGSRRRRAPRPSRRVYVKRIVDPDHPAHGEFGLYCALDRGAPPGSWLLDYVGHVTLGKDQDMRSDYVCDFGERGDLACDARRYGNEARFLNDVSLFLWNRFVSVKVYYIDPVVIQISRRTLDAARSFGTPANTLTSNSTPVAMRTGSCGRACTSSRRRTRGRRGSTA